MKVYKQKLNQTKVHTVKGRQKGTIYFMCFVIFVIIVYELDYVLLLDDFCV